MAPGFTVRQCERHHPPVPSFDVSDVALERLIKLEAVHNFRDLGGYQTTDGRRTRWGLLYRADGLHRLTPADVESLRPLGLRTVLDLRTSTELAERGTFPVDAHPVEYHHLPVIDVTWSRDEQLQAAAANGEMPDDTVAFLTVQYRALLDEGEPQLADAFRILAGAGALPAVFHCAAGKDRTGILAALLLSSLGMPDEVVADDYGLSREAMVRTREWAGRQSAEMLALWDRVPATHLAAEPAAMLQLLGELQARHGSVRAYVQSIGVDDDVLLALEDALLEPATD
jgi:protein-tyrosine phosphatase